MLDPRAGYARNGFDRSPISNGFDITSLGLSPVLASQAQVQHFPTVGWAHFGKVKVGRAERKLSCFVSTLSYSRALYLEFFLIRGSRASYAAMCAPFRIGVASRETCSVTISVQLSWSVAVMRCIFTRACLNSVLIIISWFVLVR